jgi:hypothetical protein
VMNHLVPSLFTGFYWNEAAQITKPTQFMLLCTSLWPIFALSRTMTSPF